MLDTTNLLSGDDNDGAELTSATCESNDEDDTDTGSHSTQRLSIERLERTRGELFAQEQSNRTHMTADQLKHLNRLRLAKELQEEKVRRLMPQSEETNRETKEDTPLLPSRPLRKTPLPTSQRSIPKALKTVSPREKQVSLK